MNSPREQVAPPNTPSGSGICQLHHTEDEVGAILVHVTDNQHSNHWPQVKREKKANKNGIYTNKNGIPLHLVVDSGCEKTLVPQSHHCPERGPIHPSQIKSWPCGSIKYLNKEREAPVIQSTNGAKHNTTVYTIYANLAKPLDEDAKALGILSCQPRMSLRTTTSQRCPYTARHHSTC